MHLQSAHDLYNFYALEEKTDSYIAQLYLKHLDHFMKHVYQTLSLPYRELPDSVGDTVDDILTAYVAQIAEAAGSLETNIYHGKVVTLKDAIQLVTQKDPMALPPVNEQVLPFKIARDVILEHPEAIALGTCACRKVAKNPCLPMPAEVCIIVGEPWVSYITDYNPNMFRRVSQTETVEALHAAHERGDVHAAYFKKEMKGRFFALCNCCECCCIGMRMWNMLEGAVPYLAASGYAMSVTEDCTGCGVCAEEKGCPFHAISMDEENERAVINHDRCMGCGACERTCDANALKLGLDPSKGEPLDIEALSRDLKSPTTP
jgi:NAD-dependent dihydropyrimidine dehydrogenase PreA subunit